jgi:acyl-CoA reductase-like NAD-dependent aldehyde dehydrogenase
MMLKVVSPYDNHLIKELPLADSAKMEQAIELAYEHFSDRSKWLSVPQRLEILHNVIAIMRSKIHELTAIAAEEGGKPYQDSLIEVQRAINGVELAIQTIPQVKGEQIPMGLNAASLNRIAYTQKEPTGVVASISAFNHPLNLTIHQTIPAIAVGAPVIIKPAQTTPLSCLAFMDILYEAGLPQAWCQAVVCSRDVAEQLVSDPRISYLSFIGSAKVGWSLRSKLAPGAHCALEHGGAAPVIVEADADIEEMIPALVKGGFYHAGQVCVSVQRVFVHQSILDDVASQMVKMANSLKVGDPLDQQTEVGPLILPREVDRVETWVNAAIAAGAILLCGGKRISDSCYQPTILLNPPQQEKVSSEEIFGPVICLYSYTHREDAVKLANSLNYSFQAAVFTKHIDTALEMVNKLNAAAVMINDHTAFRVDWMPFGGRKHSGMGVGGIPYTMQEMMADKLFVIKSPVL